MRDEELENDAVESISSLIPRAVPDPRFVRELEEEIFRAARQKMRYRTSVRANVSFEDMVIELRKLVRLLRKTLVPVQPRTRFAQTLGEQLRAIATELAMARQRRWRWVMVGGAVGSALSLMGLVTAFLLRRRNGQSRPEKPVGAV